jgi:hypothetical protein
VQAKRLVLFYYFYLQTESNSIFTLLLFIYQHVGFNAENVLSKSKVSAEIQICEIGFLTNISCILSQLPKNQNCGFLQSLRNQNADKYFADF